MSEANDGVKNMESTATNANEKIANPAGQDAPAVVKGPSCPAAFATWWAEYRNKLAMRASDDFRASVEGLQ
jgi:hypothetical protein